MTPEALDQMICAAVREAEAAAQRAGVEIRRMSSPEEGAALARLCDRIWNPSGKGSGPVPANVMIALEHTGNYVYGAYESHEAENPVGLGVAFFTDPKTAALHSHVVGVHPDSLRRGIGRAIKLHQRLWCLQREVYRVQWTFDPLMIRNAVFNVRRLGGSITEYLPQFYGEMVDSTNAGQGSDRLVLSWDLLKPVPELGPGPELESVPDEIMMVLESDRDMRPVQRSLTDLRAELTSDAGVVLGVKVPVDINAVRARNGELAKQWRVAVRESLAGLMSRGFHVIDVNPNGTYTLAKPVDQFP